MEQVLSDLQIERLELPVKAARRVGYALCIMFVIILLWAAIAPVNVISKGTGQLRPYGKPKLVQSQISGRIEQILVREGSHVDKGEVLVELGSSIYKSNLDRAENELKKANIKFEQLKEGSRALKEVLASPANLPVTTIDIGDTADVVNKVYTSYRSLEESKYDATVGAPKNDEMASEMTDLREQKVQYTNQKSQKIRELALIKEQLKNGIVQKKTAIAGLIAKVAAHKEMLKEVERVYSLSKEQEKDYAGVLDLGVSRVQYLKVKEQVAENKRKVQNEKATIKELENKLELAKLELPRFILETESKLKETEANIDGVAASIEVVNLKMRKNQREFRSEEAQYGAAVEKAKAAIEKAKHELETQNDQIKELKDNINIARVKLSETSVQAPMAGIVTAFKIRGDGEVVRSGQQLMEILPDKSELTIESKIANKDIGFVKSGQEAKIKLDAFPFQDFGVIKGKVEEVERYPELQQGKNGGYAYTVWVKPTQDYIFARGKKVPFRSGLTCQVEIVVRRVSVLQALLSPVAKFSEMRIKE